MKKVSLIITAMCTIFYCQACTPKKAVNDSIVKAFNMQLYLGTWYEVARIDHYFEKDMDFTQAYYSLNEDGSVYVENTGYKNGQFKKSTAKAFQPDPLNYPAHIRVSFFRPFYSDYRVLWVDTDYRYALVSSKGPNYLWILSRDPQIPEETLTAILDEAKRRGFDTDRLTWVKQETDW